MTSTSDRPKLKVPPPLVFAVLMAIAGGLERWMALDHPRGSWEVRLIPALIVALLSGYLALHAVVALKRQGTFVDPGKPTLRVVESGPFRYSRNPMYLSLVLLSLALAVLLLSLWFLLATLVLWGVLDRVAAMPEEIYLEGKFGRAYSDYKERVHRWI